MGCFPAPPIPAPTASAEGASDQNGHPVPLAGAGLRELADGVILPIDFEHNRVAPVVTDQAELQRLVDMLQRNRGLRIEIIGTAVDGEDLLLPEQFGARRARAVMWLLAGLGPSRSRFAARGAPLADEARVVLRVARGR